MAKPAKTRITLDDQNEIEGVEVMLNGKWVEATKDDACSVDAKSSAQSNDKTISVGEVAQPNSCVHDPRCSQNPAICSVWVGGCWTYSC